MGYRTVRNNDLDSLYRRKEATQYFLFIANIVMLLVASQTSLSASGSGLIIKKA